MPAVPTQMQMKKRGLFAMWCSGSHLAILAATLLLAAGQPANAADPPATPRVDGGFSNYDPSNNTLVLAGLGGNPANLGMETQYKYFAPRTGLSYRAHDATVIRMGIFG